MIDFNQFTEEKINQMIESINKDLEEKYQEIKDKNWLEWILEKVNQYGKIDDEDVGYDGSWPQEDKEKFYKISIFHNFLMDISEELSIDYEDLDSPFETYENNFTYNGEEYHIFTMIGQGVTTCISKGFEDPEKWVPIDLNNYYAG